MRLGLGPINLGQTSGSQLAALAEQATASSFDCVWVAESRADGVGGALAAAALVAQLVPIRVGAVVDAGLYHPLHLAEDIAVADLTTAGRLEVMLRPAGSDQGLLEEHLSVLAQALTGAHMQWNGERLRVPARLEANQPVPERLALNPRPAQPAVPIWVESNQQWAADHAAALGFGVAREWTAGARAPSAVGRWPGVLLCPEEVAAAELLRATGDGAAYFIVAASSPESAREVGARLAGPVRMPDFPTWIHS